MANTEFQVGFKDFDNLFPEDFGERIAAQVEECVAKCLEGLNIEEMVSFKIEKAMHKVEKATQRAHEHAQRAQERAQRVQERAQRAAERAARKAHQVHIKVDATPDETESAESPAPASEEGRLAILQMLQEGKITASQAEILLQALEG